MKRMILAVAVLLSCFACVAHAEPTYTGINVYPPDANLTTKLDLQRYIVVASRSDGVTLDVTAQAEVKIANAALAKVENHTIYPVADGQTTVDIAYQGFKVTLPVT
ncbi:MAG TPA: cell surface protein, partial [Pirellulaceae bacterium]|nr:cell surface protein [Pirellulaceae bacterium]